jgi:hypothetical protein
MKCGDILPIFFYFLNILIFVFWVEGACAPEIRNKFPRFMALMQIFIGPS